MSPLQSEIQKYVSAGFLIVHQTETTAQLRKPKQFNFGIFLVLGILLFIVGAILYVAWYASQNDEVVYLTLDNEGVVHASGTGVRTMAIPVNSWEKWAVGKSHADMVKQLEKARRQNLAPEYIRWLEEKVATQASPQSQ